ncbi:hypothetical protein NPIL_537331 [Nephila pilipes]|uniref:Uncharacterized protein n=1 Tax=Nephila pilipes TaxID=299642 RepID=A0A8X6PE56_NEPPI|nr:hypothetical protein NPIL_537331 [Nephila pilipes]
MRIVFSSRNWHRVNCLLLLYKFCVWITVNIVISIILKFIRQQLQLYKGKLWLGKLAFDNPAASEPLVEESSLNDFQNISRNAPGDVHYSISVRTAQLRERCLKYKLVLKGTYMTICICIIFFIVLILHLFSMMDKLQVEMNITEETLSEEKNITMEALSSTEPSTFG